MYFLISQVLEYQAFYTEALVSYVYTRYTQNCLLISSREKKPAVQAAGSVQCVQFWYSLQYHEMKTKIKLV